MSYFIRCDKNSDFTLDTPPDVTIVALHPLLENENGTPAIIIIMVMVHLYFFDASQWVVIWLCVMCDITLDTLMSLFSHCIHFRCWKMKMELPQLSQSSWWWCIYISLMHQWIVIWLCVVAQHQSVGYENGKCINPTTATATAWNSSSAITIA